MHIAFILRGLIGILAFVFIAWLFSENRRQINYPQILKALLFQIIIAVIVLKVPFVQTLFMFIGKTVVILLKFSKEGAAFVFGDLVEHGKYGHIFAFQILPTIIFFSAISGILFYFGVIQFFIKHTSRFFTKVFGITASESIVIIANIFIGQIEAPLMVKGYLKNTTNSGFFLIMASGMATIAGTVLATYIMFLGGY